MKIMVGDKIRIIRMNGEPQYDNKEGFVTFIDSLNQIHGTWGGCALLMTDSFVINEKENKNELKK